MTSAEFLRRLRDAVERGQQAFWSVIAASFPEASSGDFTPEATLALERSLFLAALSWSRNNLLVIRATPEAQPSDEEWANQTFNAWLAKNDKPIGRTAGTRRL
jgi:hypothetical protein